MNSLKICDSSNEKYLLYEFSRKLEKVHWLKLKRDMYMLIYICRNSPVSKILAQPWSLLVETLRVSLFHCLLIHTKDTKR